MTLDEETARAPSVLVVDDEPEMRMLVRVFLEGGGFYVVDEAGGGAEALELLQRLDPPPDPSVAILDIRMPGCQDSRRPA